MKIAWTLAVATSVIFKAVAWRIPSEESAASARGRGFVPMALWALGSVLALGTSVSSPRLLASFIAICLLASCSQLIVVKDESKVRKCQSLGTVEERVFSDDVSRQTRSRGSKKRSAFPSPDDHQREATTKVRKSAKKQGATHILWIFHDGNASEGHAAARAFRCD